MNHIYKVIWNKAKHCYTVVSEIAKSHSQSNKRVRSMTAVVAAAMMLTGFGGMAIEAANPASGDTNITIGKGASVSIWNGVPGHDGVTSGYISIGENAFAWDGEHTYKEKYARIGTKEYLLDFNQGAVSGAESFFGIPYKFRVTDGTKLAGAIAIGKNTMARTGSVMIGDHTYKGQLGDIEVDPSNKSLLNNGVYSTTLGTSSYNSGSMATVTGAFSIASGSKDTNDTQNFGATIYGSLNSIESSTARDPETGMANDSAGTANSVLGFGNRTQNANASLVWGTGNEVTNSIEDVTFRTNWNKTSASDAQKEIIKAMQSDQFAGGSVMAIGGGNKADWATYSQLLGVKNTLIGENGAVSKYDMINGYKNKVTNATHTSIIGSNNTATNIQSTIVMGDHNTLVDRKNVISLGNQNTVTADDAVAIGNGTKVTKEGGVAIGVGSVADRVADSEKGKLGKFAPDTIPTAEKSTWAATKGAVSVGDTTNNITRQITNVAAGNEDTDAVNVAQLKQVASQAERANQGWNLTTNGVAAAATNVAPGGSVDFSGDDNVSVSNKETKVTVALNKDVKLHSATFEDTVINANGLTIGNGTSGLEFSKNRVSVGGQQIHDVADGEADMDAVNMSQLKKQTAASKTTVSDGINTNVTSTEAEDGHIDYKVNLNKDVQLNSATFGDTVINANGLTIGGGTSGLEFSKNRVSVGGQQIHDVADGEADMDAVNMSQLKEKTAASKTTVSDGTNTKVTSKVAADGHTDYQVNLNKDLTGIESMTNGLSSIRMGNGGTVTINNRVTIDQSGKISGVAAGEVKEGSTDAVNGSQLKGVENKADKNAENIQKNTEAIAKNTADISKNAEAISKNTENIKNNSKAIAENAKNIQKNTEAIAKNTKDISKNTEAIGNLDKRVTKVEEVAKKHTTVSTDDTNVQISEDTNKDGGKDYKVSLNKDLNLSSVTTGDTKMDTNGVTVKDVSLTKDGLSIGNKTYVSDKGLNANDQKVTNVAAGDISEKSTDAVNGSQLFATNQQVAQNAQSISKLGNRINKVGAGAAALAALHPLDFDPDDKWDFAAGYGNYNGENAAAIGAYYRPNEDTMFSVGGSFGNGENMVNAGVSLKLGQGNHVSTSKVAMAKEIKDLRKEMEGLKSALLDANAGKKLDTSKLQLFPDVPKNHWAYEYVSTLKGNGVLTGYPDGEFKGDRPMTRYEFATMLYKAMLEGATLSDRILKEFAPELERFTVDTVHQDKDGKPTVERVRTVKAKK